MTGKALPSAYSLPNKKNSAPDGDEKPSSQPVEDHQSFSGSEQSTIPDSAAVAADSLVSIIITSHNYADYLGEAIDSALGQDHPHVEVIVVDDGSTDGSVEIIERYGKRIVPVMKSQGGQCSCFNVGIEYARGDVVIFLDADDALLTDAASAHVAALSAPGTVKSCGYMQVVDSASQPMGFRIPAQLSVSGDYRAASLTGGLEIYQNSFTSAQAWTRKFLQQVLPLPENDIIGADGYLTAVDRFFGELVFLDRPVARYRKHDRNKGPIRQRFNTRFMKKRIEGKRYRASFALQWAERLGLQPDQTVFRTTRDWRILVMQHTLHLMGEDVEPVPLRTLVSTPLRFNRRGLVRAVPTATLLSLFGILPRPVAIRMGRGLLNRSELPGARLWRKSRS